MTNFIRNIICIAGAAAMCCSTASAENNWIERDSAQAIAGRIAKDFPYSLDEGLRLMQAVYPSMTADSLRTLIDDRLVETMIIDGQERMYRKSVRNLPLLHVIRDGSKVCRGGQSSQQRQACADTIIRATRGETGYGSSHKIRYRMWIDVPYIENLEGDTLKVWMPIPKNSRRQQLIDVHSKPTEGVIYGGGEDSHNGIYLEQPVARGNDAHFEIEVEYIAKGMYFDPDSILKKIQPYKDDDNYIKYTRMESPHIVDMTAMARGIVGAETNPFKQSELIYDYIVSHYPWAGAREYSTIPCIPAYVVDRGYGDCGQVALLYISLMRSLGIPARWESGWILLPGDEGIHDWAEVYFEGIGWVPVDVSFGRYDNASSKKIRNFYSTGIDSYRMAANSGVCGPLGVPKRYIRSETVDQQVGEVECSKGNLFYPLWDYGLDVVKIEDYRE